MNMIYAAALASVAMLLSGCGTSITHQGNDMIVRSDMGGSLSEREVEIASLRYTGKKVVIDGTCASACTMYLGLENACLTPRAKLLFHGPRSASSTPYTDEIFDRMSAQIAKYYPTEIAGWFMNDARFANPMVKALSYERAVAMGARPC
ncbi:hypothetical protein SAMN05421774_101868 [Gemmobacter megaterium]|uniref:Uncharacterized protein n=1 Tax=Gemmobacter megaterium TaxID=1086013 RepID=A0A1N7L2T6_9RHOB|nr:hypothetical protein [Gemmobacter megaterium]GGE05295.1 hypothetical protein GCM10011345_08540 [Gemmobacter megaterium]SIS68169.1 hypothetical protein SAMN05421774_101868 [Gemmobacter megaterium]